MDWYTDASDRFWRSSAGAGAACVARNLPRRVTRSNQSAIRCRRDRTCTAPLTVCVLQGLTDSIHRTTHRQGSQGARRGCFARRSSSGSRHVDTAHTHTNTHTHATSAKAARPARSHEQQQQNTHACGVSIAAAAVAVDLAKGQDDSLPGGRVHRGGHSHQGQL